MKMQNGNHLWAHPQFSRWKYKSFLTWKHWNREPMTLLQFYCSTHHVVHNFHHHEFNCWIGPPSLMFHKWGSNPLSQCCNLCDSTPWLGETEAGLIIFAEGGQDPIRKSWWAEEPHLACWEEPSDQPLLLSQALALRILQTSLQPVVQPKKI